MPTSIDAAETVAELYRTHSVGLGRAALLLLGDRGSAEDVVQEAFLGLHRRWLRDGMPDDPVAYVRASVVNRCRSVLRRRVLRVLPASQPARSPESQVVLDEQRREVIEAVARLPRRQREVLVLKYYLDLPEAEIATTLGVSRGTVSSSASRALKSLEDRLGEEFA